MVKNQEKDYQKGNNCITLDVLNILQWVNNKMMALAFLLLKTPSCKVELCRWAYILGIIISGCP